MKIEILFPEVCNLFADNANMNYLKLCLPNAEFIETHLNERPKFLDEEINFVYMGPTSENSQRLLIQRLMPLKEAISEKIENGTNFLFTGNAVEILGNYIETEKKEKIPALAIFDLYAVQNLKERHNSECIAKFKDMKIYAFKSQFTLCYPQNEDSFLFEVERGMGMNRGSKKEGIHYKNFHATYLIGPLLILNPDFTKYLLELIGEETPKLAFEEEMYNALKIRAADFERNVPVDVADYKYM